MHLQRSIRSQKGANVQELMEQLVSETTEADIPPKYREIVNIIGVDKFALMSEYAQGDPVYFPKLANITAPARNRHIKQEYNGWNKKELAKKYDLTVKQIECVLRDVPPPGQMSLSDWERESGKKFGVV